MFIMVFYFFYYFVPFVIINYVVEYLCGKKKRNKNKTKFCSIQHSFVIFNFFYFFSFILSSLFIELNRKKNK